MDPGSIQIPNGTIRGTGTSSKPPPSPIWIIIPLVVVLVMGALIAIAYRLVTRWQRRRTVAGDAEQATTGPETTVLEVGDAAAGAGGLAPDSGPTDRWAWVFDPSSSSGSGRGRHGAARMSEGLNELGEAPPPYGEDNEGPKSYVAEMVEVGDGGEGASGTAPQQGQSGAGPEPPAYELAVGPDETSSSLSLSSSIREPPPAVTPRPR